MSHIGRLGTASICYEVVCYRYLRGFGGNAGWPYGIKWQDQQF